MRVETSVDIATTIDQAWAALTDFKAHTEWMNDAVDIRFIGEQTSGEGTTFDCDTKVGPFFLTDRMTVTDWAEPNVVGVKHTAVVPGEGAFRIKKTDRGVRVEWSEVLHLPWYYGGPFGALVAKPILSHMWKGNLQRLKAILE